MDDAILDHIDKVFGIVRRPESFTVGDGDPECMEYDKLFHSHDPSTLPIDAFTGILSPLSELLVDGLKYYMPRLVRFSLVSPADDEEWAGIGLLDKLMRRDVLTGFKLEQRVAVVEFLKHLRYSRPYLVEEFYRESDFNFIFNMWSDSIKTPLSE